MQIQFTRKKEPGLCMFLEPELRDRLLVFVVETVRWNPATEENDPVSTKTLMPEQFSLWWDEVHLKGWRIQP